MATCPRWTAGGGHAGRPTRPSGPATPSGTRQLVHEFHDLIVTGADNSKLEGHYRTLMNQLAYARLVRPRSPAGRLIESDPEHHRVLSLIQAKDGDGAERVMREHVRASHQALMQGMDERGV